MKILLLDNYNLNNKNFNEIVSLSSSFELNVSSQPSLSSLKNTFFSPFKIKKDKNLHSFLGITENYLLQPVSSADFYYSLILREFSFVFKEFLICYMHSKLYKSEFEFWRTEQYFEESRLTEAFLIIYNYCKSWINFWLA